MVVGLECSDALEMAAEECRRLLKAVPGVGELVSSLRQADFTLSLRLDPGLHDGQWRLTAHRAGGNLSVRVGGADTGAALCGLYTLLEQAGFGFFPSGCTVPDALQLDRIPEGEAQWRPALRRRGVRQHLNFPMDVSSCSLVQAKRYVRNLARMRFDAITFHSYPGQFYAYEYAGKRHLAGNYFYGEVQPVAGIETVAGIADNEEYFCIPENEACFCDPEQSSRAAVRWLGELVAECKRFGMEVTFSFEPRGCCVAEGVAAVQAILAAYPGVDCIELMTQECGCAWDADPGLTAQRLEYMVQSAFGRVPERAKRHLKDGLVQLPVTLAELKRNLEILQALPSSGVAKRFGVYCTCQDSLEVVLALTEKQRRQYGFAVLPAHASPPVAQAVSGLKEWDLSSATLYSWAQFDGLMFLAQNGCEGIGRLARESADGLGGVLYNHWQTAECDAALCYAARQAVQGPVPLSGFYADYAAARGMDAGAFAGMMGHLAAAEELCRERLPNIGFCAVYCWFTPGLGYIGRYAPGDIRAAREEYLLAGECAERLGGGSAPVNLYRSRIAMSVAHLDCMLELSRLAGLRGEDREAARDICNAALAHAKRYLCILSASMPDRSGQGLAVSYYKTVPHYIYVLRERLAGVPVPERYEKRLEDAPPSPFQTTTR